jgi:hypothetical protein
VSDADLWERPEHSDADDRTVVLDEEGVPVTDSEDASTGDEPTPAVAPIDEE